MNAAQHTAQRDAVRASLACTHHPDVYGARPNLTHGGTHARPADEGRVSAVPLRTAPSHGAQPEEAGRDGWAARPTHPSQHVCTCGHLDGDHQDGRNRSLTPGPLGLCLISGCDCSRFEAAPVARQIPNSRRAA